MKTTTLFFALSACSATELVPELRCTSHATSDVTRIGFAFYFYDASGHQIWRDRDAKPFYSLDSTTPVIGAGKTATVAVGADSEEGARRHDADRSRNHVAVVRHGRELGRARRTVSIRTPSARSIAVTSAEHAGLFFWGRYD